MIYRYDNFIRGVKIVEEKIQKVVEKFRPHYHTGAVGAEEIMIELNKEFEGRYPPEALGQVMNKLRNPTSRW